METTMKMKLFLFILTAYLFTSGTCLASCYVEDPTFYSKDKHSIMTFAMAMEQGKKNKALSMVDDGRIKSCSRASCSVIERLDNGFVHVYIAGIGKAWIYHTFLHCK